MKKVTKKLIPKRSYEIPASRGLVEQVRSELKTDMASLTTQLKAQRAEVTYHAKSQSKRLGHLNLKADSLDEKIHQTHRRIDDFKVEVSSKFHTLRGEMNRKFEKVDKRFEQIDKRFEQVDKRFEQIDKRFEQIDKRFEQIDRRFEQIDKRFNKLEVQILKVQSSVQQIAASVHGMKALFEEQLAQNKYVLDGYTSLYDSQDNIKNRLLALEKKTFGEIKI